MDDRANYVSLNRKILDWGWYTDTNTKILFIHILLKANWKAGEFQGVHIPRGSLATSYPKLSTQLGISVRQIRTALNHLKSTGEVTVKPYHDFSVITVVKYNEYQWSDRPSDRQPTGNRQATDNNRIREKGNKEINNTNMLTKEVSDSVKEDFETIYTLYRKKKGKAKAYEYYRQWTTKGRVISGQKIKLTREQIATAVLTYVEMNKDTELMYWKDFSTLMNKDILDYVKEVNK